MKKIQRKLGCNCSQPDRRTLWLSSYLPKRLPVPPASADWTKKVTAPWRVMGNDTVGNCAVVAPGHMEMGWSYNAGKGFIPSDADILRDYEKISGYTPGDPSTDVGCDPLSVLKYWRKTGIAGRKIGAFVGLNVSRQIQFQQAVYLFGSAYVALALPVAAQSLDTWDVPAGQPLTGDWEPGGWGGHAVEIPKYDDRWSPVVTWGELKQVSWRFVMAYCQEAFAVLSPDLFDGTGKCPVGFDIETLKNDLCIIASQ